MLYTTIRTIIKALLLNNILKEIGWSTDSNHPTFLCQFCFDELKIRSKNNNKEVRENMLYTIVKQNSYQDSVNLMLLTNKISTMEGITKTQIMMGTPANKDILKAAGLFTDELESCCFQ